MRNFEMMLDAIFGNKSILVKTEPTVIDDTTLVADVVVEVLHVTIHPGTARAAQNLPRSNVVLGPDLVQSVKFRQTRWKQTMQNKTIDYEQRDSLIMSLKKI